MPALTSLVLSAALLTAGPAFSNGEGLPNLAQAQAFTVAANVLGAATACQEIPHDRLSAAARRVGALAVAKAASAEDVPSIERLLIESAAAGRQAVKGGQADCNTVEAAFGQLERDVLQTPA